MKRVQKEPFNLDFIRALLKRKYPVNFDTMLSAAADRHDLPAFRFALRHGANPNWCEAYGKKRSILHEVALTGNMKLVNALLRYPVDVTYRDANGETALDRVSSEFYNRLPHDRKIAERLRKHNTDRSEAG